MDQTIDMQNPLSCAHWCGNFCCTADELAYAIRVMDSTEVGLVGLYLAHAPPRAPITANQPAVNKSR